MRILPTDRTGPAIRPIIARSSLFDHAASGRIEAAPVIRRVEGREPILICQRMASPTLTARVLSSSQVSSIVVWWAGKLVAPEKYRGQLSSGVELV